MNDFTAVDVSAQGNNAVRIFDIAIAAVDRRTLTKAFGDLLTSGKRGWISYANIHALNLAVEIPWFKKYLQNSLLTYCDGEGVKLGARLLGHRIPERIVFSDWIDDVCQVAASQRLGIYLLGGKEGVAETAASKLSDRIPGLIVSGTHHGFFHSEDEERIVKQINDSKAQILIVGMGMPLQESWILSHHQLLTPNIILNAGSCFDYVAGAKRRCPGWMGKFGLEWVYRLFQEPRRLWKRYLIGNPLFILRVLSARFRPQS
jgi:N-acetylglucosaminyldiphosphoundecaprenol N-acetyl-beta-D-mannosaminyltransferase